jgi:hypothetical protein
MPLTLLPSCHQDETPEEDLHKARPFPQGEVRHDIQVEGLQEGKDRGARPSCRVDLRGSLEGAASQEGGPLALPSYLQQSQEKSKKSQARKNKIKQ